MGYMVSTRIKPLSSGKLAILAGMAIAKSGIGATTAECLRVLIQRGFEMSLAKASTLRARLEGRTLLKKQGQGDRRGGPELYAITHDGKTALEETAIQLRRELKLVEDALQSLKEIQE